MGVTVTVGVSGVFVRVAVRVTVGVKVDVTVGWVRVAVGVNVNVGVAVEATVGVGEAIGVRGKRQMLIGALGPEKMFTGLDPLYSGLCVASGSHTPSV